MSTSAIRRLAGGLEWAMGFAILGLATWLRTREFPATWTHLDAAYPYIQGALQARGEPPPLVGAPAAFSLRHGAINAWLTGPAVWATRDFIDAAQLVAALRALPVAVFWVVGRLLGVRWLGLAIGLGFALSPLSIQYARSGGGTYFLEVLLCTAILFLTLAARRGPLWAFPAAAVIGCLPFCHPMGAPLAGGLVIGLWPYWRGRGAGLRIALAACLLAAAVPYAIAELQTGRAGFHSVIGMLQGELRLAPEGDEGVGFWWSLDIIARRAAGPVAGLMAVVGSMGVLLLASRGGRSVLRWRKPLHVALAGSAAAGLSFLWLLQLRSGYGLEHHPLPFFLPLAALFLSSTGAMAEHWGGRGRMSATALGVMALLMTTLIGSQELPKTLERDESWSPGIMSMGNIEGVAGQIYIDSAGKPFHVALVHSPEVEIGTPLIGVAAALLCWGVDPARMPFDPPPGEPVAGYLIEVGPPVSFRQESAPGERIPTGIIHSDPEIPVRLSRVEDFATIRDWAEELPQGWRSFGPEEYLDTIDYTRRLPMWGGVEEPHVPLLDSPYPFRW